MLGRRSRWQVPLARLPPPSSPPVSVLPRTYKGQFDNSWITLQSSDSTEAFPAYRQLLSHLTGIQVISTRANSAMPELNTLADENGTIGGQDGLVTGYWPKPGDTTIPVSWRQRTSRPQVLPESAPAWHLHGCISCVNHVPPMSMANNSSIRCVALEADAVHGEAPFVVITTRTCNTQPVSQNCLH